jgi:carbon-monoxide dehydrogenase medium subunit
MAREEKMSSRILPEFELLMPQDISEAVGLLGEYGQRAVVMAGGTDVMVLMKDGFKPELVMSLAGISGQDYLTFPANGSDGLIIGSMATVSQINDSTQVQEKYQALWQSTLNHGTPQTRNVATVLGNIMRASPAGDCSVAVLALGATVVLQGPNEKRQIAIDDFFLDNGVTARKPDELGVELRIPRLDDNMVTAFGSLTRTCPDCSKVNAAVRLTMDGKVCKDARLAIGSVAPTPVRLKKTEALLKNTEITDDVLERVVASVPTEISPIDDVRSTRNYRSQVSGILVKRTILDACKGI